PVVLDFSLFYSKYDDLIEPNFTPMEKPIIRFENIEKAQILGFEVSLKTLLFKTAPFFVGFTSLEPKDLKDNKILKYRSRMHLVSSLSIPYKFIAANVDFRYISKIERLDDILKLLMEDYDAIVPIYVLDASLSFDLTGFKLPLSITISAQNLLDYYYVEMVGNLAPTRLISLRIQYKY
ncbi:MAG: TonB-dependent receptor, partial [Candidatus Kapaibacteriota bacterium]